MSIWNLNESTSCAAPDNLTGGTSDTAIISTAFHKYGKADRYNLWAIPPAFRLPVYSSMLLRYPFASCVMRIRRPSALRWRKRYSVHLRKPRHDQKSHDIFTTQGVVNHRKSIKRSRGVKPAKTLVTTGFSSNHKGFSFGGAGGIRTHVRLPSNWFRISPVMTTSIPLHLLFWTL